MTKRKITTSAIVLFSLVAAVLMLAWLPGCPNHYSMAWKGTAGVMRATNTASKAWATTADEKYTLCIKNGAKTPEYASCIKKDLAQLESYRDNIRPTARSVVAASYGAILIAKEAGKPDIDYKAILKPGACALILGLREWGHKLPDSGKVILSLLEGFTGLACDKPKNAASLITALLPVAVDLVKWIVQLVGASDDTLQKEVYTWIMGSPIDEADAMIIKLRTALP